MMILSFPFPMHVSDLFGHKASIQWKQFCKSLLVDVGD